MCFIHLPVAAEALRGGGIARGPAARIAHAPTSVQRWRIALEDCLAKLRVDDVVPAHGVSS